MNVTLLHLAAYSSLGHDHLLLPQILSSEVYSILPTALLNRI